MTSPDVLEQFETALMVHDHWRGGRLGARPQRTRQRATAGGPLSRAAEWPEQTPPARGGWRGAGGEKWGGGRTQISRMRSGEEEGRRLVVSGATVIRQSVDERDNNVRIPNNGVNEWNFLSTCAWPSWNRPKGYA